MKAVISACGTYRYTLYRRVPDVPCRWIRRILFIMLNPSTADAKKEDPTSRKCMHYSRRELFTDMTLVNLFAFRSPHPTVLWKARKDGLDIIGPENDRYLDEQIKLHSGLQNRIVVAFGAHPKAKERAGLVLGRIPNMYCLGLSQDGYPRHPLMLPNATEFQKLEKVYLG